MEFNNRLARLPFPAVIASADIYHLSPTLPLSSSFLKHCLNGDCYQGLPEPDGKMDKLSASFGPLKQVAKESP